MDILDNYRVGAQGFLFGRCGRHKGIADAEAYNALHACQHIISVDVTVIKLVSQQAPSLGQWAIDDVGVQQPLAVEVIGELAKHFPVWAHHDVGLV